MGIPREAVILVPGMNGTVPRVQRDRLAEGLRVIPRDRIVEEEPPPDDTPVPSVRLQVGGEGEPRHLDVTEAFWGDLRPRLTERPLLARLLGGGRLLGFWLPILFHPRIQRGRWMLVSAVVSSLGLLLWYLSILLLGGQAATAVDGVAALVETLHLGWLFSRESPVAAAVFALAGTEMIFLPVAQLVDMAHVARAYLTDEPVGEGEAGFRSRCAARVKEVIHEVRSGGEYDRITVVGHSFGATIAVDVLASMPLADDGPPVRLVTLGGTLEISALRRPAVLDHVRACREREAVVEWIDLWTDSDWLCAATPEPEGAGGSFRSERVEHHAGLGDKIMGRTHDRYFVHPRAVEVLLA